MFQFFKNFVSNLSIKHKWRKELKCSWRAQIRKGSVFEGANRIYGNTLFDGAMGYGSYIGSKGRFLGEIGRFTSIAERCNVIVGRHPYKMPFATTCPMFFSLKKQNGHTFANRQLYNEFKTADCEHTVSVGSDCWIGYDVKLIQGVRIADGAIVLAGAVVTKDVPPYAIVGGVPAKIVGYRYDEETVEFLIKTKWWTNTEEWYLKNWKLMTDMDELKKYYQENHL